eukprot:12406286-Karenia_brevis.AAC.1
MGLEFVRPRRLPRKSMCPWTPLGKTPEASFGKQILSLQKIKSDIYPSVTELLLKFLFAEIVQINVRLCVRVFM